MIDTSKTVQQSASMQSESRHEGSIPFTRSPSENDASVSESVSDGAGETIPETVRSTGDTDLRVAPSHNIIAFPQAKTVAAESAHWYLPDGSPFYEVPYADSNKEKRGQMRPANLTDARKVGAVPSVTTITGLVEKPALSNYKEEHVFKATLRWLRGLEQHLLDILLNRTTDLEALDLKGSFQVVKEGSREHSKKAADRGSELHAAIEEFLQGKLITDKTWMPHIANLVKTLCQYGINIREGAPEKSFAHGMGFGGKVDWHKDAGRPSNGGNYGDAPIVMDFKSKEKIDDKKLKMWADSSKSMQLAAYRVGLGIETARCINVFVGCEDKQVRIHEWPESDIKEAWEKFSLLLRFWRKENHYYPKGNAQ